MCEEKKKYRNMLEFVVKPSSMPKSYFEWPRGSPTEEQRELWRISTKEAIEASHMESLVRLMEEDSHNEARENGWIPDEEILCSTCDYSTFDWESHELKNLMAPMDKVIVLDSKKIEESMETYVIIRVPDLFRWRRIRINSKELPVIPPKVWNERELLIMELEREKKRSKYAKQAEERAANDLLWDGICEKFFQK